MASKERSSYSILHVRLVVLVLLAATPAVAVMLYTAGQVNGAKRNLLVMFAGVLLSLAAARFVGLRFILRPVTAIVNATNEFALGNLGARTGLSNRHGELSLLARAVDGMAQELEAQQLQAKLSQDALQLTQFTLDHAAEAALWIGLDGRLLYVNEALCKLLDRSREELLKKTFQEIDAYTSGQVWTKLCRLTRNNGPLTIEARLHREGGTPVPVEVTASYLEFNGNQYICAFGRDITERKRMEQALDQSSREYRSLFEKANDALLILDEHDEVILDANRRAFEVYGFDAGEMIGMNLKRIAGPPHPNGSKESEPGASRRHTNFETVHMRKDGTRLDVSVSTSVIAYNRRRAVLSINRDITQLKRIERHLVQSEKLSGLGRLISGVAHELNNPLTSVLGYTQLLLRASPADDQVRERLEIIRREAERTRSIVQNLMLFSGQHKPRPEQVDVNELLSRTLELCRHGTLAADRHIVLELADGVTILGDRHQLQQVFNNVILNAEQALQEKGPDGTIAISTRRERKESREWVTVTISDNGAGIQPEHITKVFDPFFTTRGVGRGTGLGLSVSYGIVEEHGGTVRVESHPGEGSTFIIDLPTEPVVNSPIAC
ncbi:MAG TPA: PAS domain S-box protein [Blastocatellia bacterium]|nr:PAS domain S-box protein [Blastocatellia bacterium]